MQMRQPVLSPSMLFLHQHLQASPRMPRLLDLRFGTMDFVPSLCFSSFAPQLFIPLLPLLDRLILRKHLAQHWVQQSVRAILRSSRACRLGQEAASAVHEGKPSNVLESQGSKPLAQVARETSQGKKRKLV